MVLHLVCPKNSNMIITIKYASKRSTLAALNVIQGVLVRVVFATGLAPEFEFCEYVQSNAVWFTSLIVLSTQRTVLRTLCLFVAC
jgi:hypothetical protein